MKLEFPAQAWPKLKAALQHIADHPAEFYMPDYILREYWATDSTIRLVEWTTGHKFPECGTVACLAGHIVLQSDPDTDLINARRAIRVLGIDVETYEYSGEFVDEVAEALRQTFVETDIRTYRELCAKLTREFVFPEPLPEPT